MRSKHLIVAFVATLSVVILVAVAAVTVFALVDGDTTQVEEVLINEPVQVAPAEVEAVSQPNVEKPVINYERTGYAGHEGGCSFSSKAKLQMTQAPSQPEEASDQLLTLAE